VNKLLLCHNVRLVHSSVGTIRDNADRITEKVQIQEPKCLFSKTTAVLSE